MSTQNNTSTTSSRWGFVALGASILSNLFLITICLTYYSILNNPGLMSSRVASRGGLSEINGIIPLLAIIAAAGGIMAANLKTSKSLAIISASVGAMSWCCSLVLVYFIYTSLR
jgi:hypothetical protein